MSREAMQMALAVLGQASSFRSRTARDKHNATMVALRAALGAPDPVAQPVYTYASTQATNCAGCGKHKHTPLRIDAMGGYVCLTCVDKKLGTMLGEFGYPAPQDPLTDEQVDELLADDCPNRREMREFARYIVALTYRKLQGEVPHG